MATGRIRGSPGTSDAPLGDAAMGKIYNTIFWMKWPPPWWAWALAAVVTGGAAAMILLAAP